jgi:hypothetical protein
LPWNVPFFLAMLKLAPAMAAGCTMVLKASPETPLNANLLAETAHKVGVPPGVLNVIAAGPKSSELLVTHPGIDKVAFTGSTAVGKRIAGLAAAHLKRMTLELGGKSAAIVLDDADLAKTMAQLIATMCTTSAPNSSGLPNRLGWGTCAPNDRFNSAGAAASIGVSKVPGAMVMTRMRLLARSRATGSVMAATPPFEAEYAA